MSHEHQNTPDVRTISDASVARRIQEMRDVEAVSLRRRIRGDLISIGIGAAIASALLGVACWILWKHL